MSLLLLFSYIEGYNNNYVALIFKRVNHNAEFEKTDVIHESLLKMDVNTFLTCNNAFCVVLVVTCHPAYYNTRRLS